MFLLAAFSAGVIILYWAGELLAPALILVALLGYFLCPGRGSLFLLLLLLGWCFASQQARGQLERILPSQWEGVEVSQTGYRCSLLQSNPHFLGFDVCLLPEEGVLQDPWRSGKVRVYLALADASAVPTVGVRYLWRLRLQRPHGLANPDGAPFERYLFGRAYVATGRALGFATQAQPLPWSVRAASKLLSVRETLAQRLDFLLAQRTHAGILRALALGDRSRIDAPTQRLLTETGVQHLLAISGLHVGIVCAWLWYFLQRRRGAICIIALLSMSYVALTGFAESAQRAWLMGVLVYWVLSGRGTLNPTAIWLLALVGVLVWHPLATLGMGFWFSFAAVGVVLLVLSLLSNARSQPWFALLMIQLILAVALLPLYQHFGVPSNGIALMANLLAIPLVSLLILPLVLLAVIAASFHLSIGRALFMLADGAAELLLSLLEALSQFPLSLPLNQPIWVMAGASLLVLALLLVPRKPWLLALLPPLVLMLTVSRQAPLPEQFLVFDSGQGLALALQSGDDVWLYDLGPAHARGSVLESVIRPYFLRRQTRLAATGVIVSHGDLDHAGGLAELWRHFAVEQLWVGEPDRIPLAMSSSAETCRAGMDYVGEGYRLSVLYPFSGYEPDTANNHSCVVMLHWAGHRFLLMGDVEGEGERALARRYGAALQADVLVAGHHGSNNATRWALLKQVAPRYVVFSAGYRNRFNHPHPAVLKRVREFGAEPLLTAQRGALSFTSQHETLQVQAVRQSSAAFWMDALNPAQP